MHPALTCSSSLRSSSYISVFVFLSSLLGMFDRFQPLESAFDLFHLVHVQFLCVIHLLILSFCPLGFVSFYNATRFLCYQELVFSCTVYTCQQETHAVESAPPPPPPPKPELTLQSSRKIMLHTARKHIMMVISKGSTIVFTFSDDDSDQPPSPFHGTYIIIEKLFISGNEKGDRNYGKQEFA